MGQDESIDFWEQQTAFEAVVVSATDNAVMRTASGSDIVLLPINDVFGWRDRINTPALIDARNWTWRLPWPVEDLATATQGRERATFARGLAAKYERSEP